jgi:hypothetical protein
MKSYFDVMELEGRKSYLISTISKKDIALSFAKTNRT